MIAIKGAHWSNTRKENDALSRNVPYVSIA